MSLTARTARTAPADALEDRRMLVDAAVAAFAEHGVDVPVRDIMRRAGVGRAVFFRHFPTRAALVGAILEVHLEQLRAVAAEASDGAASGREALVGYVERATAIAIADRSFFTAVHPDDLPRAAIGAAQLELRAELTALLARGSRDGSLRDDVTAEDLQFLIRAIAVGAVREPGRWPRHLALLLDSLRPHDATALPAAPAQAAAGDDC